MSYHDTTPNPAAVRALVRRARAALTEGASNHVCAQRFASPEGPALYVLRRTEAEAAAALLTDLGPLRVELAPMQSLPTVAEGMSPEASVYALTRST